MASDSIRILKQERDSLRSKKTTLQERKVILTSDIDSVNATIAILNAEIDDINASIATLGG